MSDLSNNNSFIPKRGPANKKKAAATSRPVYVFTIISYMLLFATLIATAGVYFYGQIVERQLNNAIAELNSEISSFSESDMQRVLEFDLRLSQAFDRLDNSVSVASVFDALEDATIDTVQIASLDLEREGDEQFILSATIETDSFDSTIFQRGVYQRNQTIASVDISALQNNRNIAFDSNQNTNIPLVSFVAGLNVPLSEVPYIADPVIEVAEPLTIEESDIEEGEETEVGTDEAMVDESENNNETI